MVTKHYHHPLVDPAEVSFIDHCEGDCGLGYAMFYCPACGVYSQSYEDLWWDHETKERIELTCEECKTPLVASAGPIGWTITRRSS